MESLMTNLSRYNFTKLCDDIKLIARSIRIIKEENNQSNRERAAQLSEDLVNRLYRDILEMHRDGVDHNKDYGGYIEDKEI